MKTASILVLVVLSVLAGKTWNLLGNQEEKKPAPRTLTAQEKYEAEWAKKWEEGAEARRIEKIEADRKYAMLRDAAHRNTAKVIPAQASINKRPQTVPAYSRVRIPPGLSDYERALFVTEQQGTDVDLYSEYETRRQQGMAEAQRQQTAQLAADQAALRKELQEARQRAESARAEQQRELDDMKWRHYTRPMEPGEDVRVNW